MVARHSKDLLTSNLAATFLNSGARTHAEVSQKIEKIVRFHRRIQAVENRQVHLFGSMERTTAVTNDVRMSEMKIRGEPDIGRTK